MQQLLLVAWEVAEVNSTQQRNNNNNNNKRRITRRGMCIKISCITHILSYYPPPPLSNCSIFKSETTSTRQAWHGGRAEPAGAAGRRHTGVCEASSWPSHLLSRSGLQAWSTTHDHTTHHHTITLHTLSTLISFSHHHHHLPNSHPPRPPPSLPLTPIHLLASHLRHTSGSSFLYIHPSSIGAIGSKSGRLSRTASVRKDDNTATTAEQANDGGIPPYMKEARRRASSMQVCALIYSYTDK